MEFDIEKFKGIYPQFAEASEASLRFAWQNALMISGLEDNTEYTDAQKENLLFMLVCHLMTLADRGTAGAMVGATEGSVSVSFSAPQTGTEAEWYQLTPCGAAYWQIMKGHRYGGLWFGGSKC